MVAVRHVVAEVEERHVAPPALVDQNSTFRTPGSGRPSGSKK
jgi:hypothetical protein